MQMDRTDLAIEHWTLALAVHPNNVDLLRRIGNAHAVLKQLDQATVYWQRALAVAPNDPETTHNLILAFVVLGRIDEAADALGDADLAGVRVDPSLHEAILAAGKNGAQSM